MTKKPYRLLAPGPVPLPKAVQAALSRPILHHRTPEFEKILTGCLHRLKDVFQTKHYVILHASTGSGGMESALLNIVQPGDEVLCVVSGKFGERWAKMANTYGAIVHTLNVEWGSPVDVDHVQNLLKQYPDIKAVFTQVCETSTATVHSIKELAERVHATSSALVAVDAITAMGCMNLPMDEWGLDVVVAGSQKAFMLPTGLSFVGFSERAWQVCQKNPQPRFYFDWRPELAANEKSQTFFSSPGTHLMALDVVLKEFESFGFHNIVRRGHHLAEATRQGAKALGLDLFSKAPADSVTAIAMPEGVDSQKIRSWLETEHNITVMGGQDQLKGKIIRVGHMGDITDEDMLVFFECLAQGLSREDRLPVVQKIVREELAKAAKAFQ